VVLNRDDYNHEAQRQLSDTSFYHPLTSNPTDLHASEISAFLLSSWKREGLSEASITLLVPPKPRTPTFYLLPKIHKQGNPGRPIVASFDSPTERISALVDHHLQPLVRKLPSFIQDTNHFLRRLRSIPHPLPPNTIMATIDVCSLYTNIPHPDGLAALRTCLDTRPMHSPSTKFLITLAEMMITKNNFTFRGHHYIQTKGTAMGTRMAPSYANFFLGE
jgi:hypothetical protein